MSRFPVSLSLEAACPARPVAEQVAEQPEADLKQAISGGAHTGTDLLQETGWSASRSAPD